MKYSIDQLIAAAADSCRFGITGDALSFIIAPAFHILCQLSEAELANVAGGTALAFPSNPSGNN